MVLFTIAMLHSTFSHGAVYNHQYKKGMRLAQIKAYRNRIKIASSIHSFSNLLECDWHFWHGLELPFI